MFLTVVVFRYVRTSPNHEVATPVAAFVAANSDSPKTLMDRSEAEFQRASLPGMG